MYNLESGSYNNSINSNVILFGSMFIVGGALFETGMANKTRHPSTNHNTFGGDFIMLEMKDGKKILYETKIFISRKTIS